MPTRKPRPSATSQRHPAESLQSLYPPGHPPFIPRGLRADEQTAELIQLIAQEPTLLRCLAGAMWSLGCARFFLEQLRAELFRSEQLIQTQPFHAPGSFGDLPQHVAVLLDSLNAARQVLEEWLESETCKTLLVKKDGGDGVDS